MILAEPRPRIVGGREPACATAAAAQALIKALDALSGVTQAESGHLAFVDAATLDRAATAGRLARRVRPPPAAWLAPGEPQDFIGPFVLEKRHPLLLGHDARRRRVGGRVPLAAGARASARARPAIGCSIGMRSAGTATAILFNLDLDRTNLIRSPDWPILISNLVEMRRQSLPGPERWNYRSRRMGARAPRTASRRAAAASVRRRSSARCRPAGRSSSSRRRRADCSRFSKATRSCSSSA